MQLLATILLSIILAGAPSCANDPPPRSSPEQLTIDPWTIRITTSGGFGGLAEGGWIIDSQGNVAAGRELEAHEPHYKYRHSCKGKLSEADLRKVTQLVSSAKPSGWSARYVNPQRPYGYADGVGILFELSYRVVGGGENARTASWDDAARDQVPEELLSLYEETRLLRLEVLKDCEEGEDKGG